MRLQVFDNASQTRSTGLEPVTQVKWPLIPLDQSRCQGGFIKRRDHKDTVLGFNVKLVLRIGYVGKERPNPFVVAQA